MKIQTVNVIEVNSPANIVITSFPDTREGNAAAEQTFTNILKEQKMDDGEPVFSDNDIEICIEHGYAEFMGWELYLIHSE